MTVIDSNSNKIIIIIIDAQLKPVKYNIFNSYFIIIIIEILIIVVIIIKIVIIIIETGLRYRRKVLSDNHSYHTSMIMAMPSNASILHSSPLYLYFKYLY